MNFLKKIIRRKNEDKNVLSLDLGTRAAKALVSHIDLEKKTVVNLGVGKAKQKTGSIVGGKICDTEAVTEACRNAIEEATKMAGVEPQEVIIGLSGNTVRASTRSFEIIREKPQEKLNIEELKISIKDVHERATEEIYLNLTYREKEKGVKLISADILDFSIDGYRVLNPLNFKGSRLKISISISYVISPDFDIINDIADQLKLKLLKIAYGPYAVIKALGAEGALGFNAILIDTGGNITDVVLVKNGNIQRAEMFILGGHLFTKRLANCLRISEEEAEEVKIRYSKNRLREDDAKRIEKILEEDVGLWLSGVEIVLQEFSSKELLPHRILLYGGGIQLPGLAGSLNLLKKTGMPFSDKIKIDFIKPGHIANNLNQTEKLDDFQDMTLAGLTHLSFDDIKEEDPANTLLAEIISKK